MRTSVKGDDAHIVDHLLADRHVIFRLSNLKIAVVPRTEPRHTKRETAVAQWQILGAIRRMQFPVLRSRSLSLLSFRRQLGDSSIRRVGDDSYFQITQTKDYVAIGQEMIHDV